MDFKGLGCRGYPPRPQPCPLGPFGWVRTALGELEHPWARVRVGVPRGGRQSVVGPLFWFVVVTLRHGGLVQASCHAPWPCIEPRGSQLPCQKGVLNVHCSGAIPRSQPCSITSQWSYIDPLSTGVREIRSRCPASVQAVRERGSPSSLRAQVWFPAAPQGSNWYRGPRPSRSSPHSKLKIILPNSTWLE